MPESIEQFKSFVRRHPNLRDVVRSGEFTWQHLYEEWSILGEDDPSWKVYASESRRESQPSNATGQDGQEFIKTALNYIKRFNPDDVTKYINNAQKVLGLVQMFNGGSKKTQNSSPANYRPRRPVDPLFRRFDD